MAHTVILLSVAQSQVIAGVMPAQERGLMCAVLSRFGHARLFATSWTGALQAPLFMGFSRKEYWSGCHLLLQGIFLT